MPWVEDDYHVRNATIRTALIVTIAGYTAALVFVIAASVAGLKTTNAALEKMYAEEAVALLPRREPRSNFAGARRSRRL